MSDNEKFEGFKEKLISDNEKQYGKEIREKHGFFPLMRKRPRF